MPFRAKGIPAGVQIQNYKGELKERNPYNHTSQDSIAHMNLDYWLEQVKATTAIAGQLAVPIAVEKTMVFLPIIWKAD